MNNQEFVLSLKQNTCVGLFINFFVCENSFSNFHKTKSSNISNFSKN